MWEFLMGIFIGKAIGKSAMGRFVMPALKLVALGILISGLIYTYVFVKAALERRHDTHVHARRSY
jgi:hypothetical protein